MIDQDTHIDPDLLRAFALGELDDDAHSRLQDHLDRCDACCAVLEEAGEECTFVALLRRANGPLGAAPEGNETGRTLPPRAAASSLPANAPTLVPGITASGARPAGQALGDTIGGPPILFAGSHSPELTNFLAPAQAPDEIGRLGSYRVLAVLGKGGMGVVFRAMDPHLERLVALKAMLPGIASVPSARERFFREARAAAALKHAHIVTIHQVGEDRGAPFLAMELLEGEPLDKCIEREGRLPVPEIVRIGRETALGLAAAHEKGLIHRDIKPANIWLEASPGPRSGEYHVKILDFGLARSLTEQTQLTQSGLIVGTPSYMAPEQADGKKVDVRSDLFSLGVVLYEAAAGKQPFERKTLTATLRAITDHQPPPPVALRAGLSPGLSQLIVRLMAKDPAGRPASAQEVAAALQQLAQGSEPPSIASTSPAARQRRWAVIGGVAAAAVLLVLGGVFLPRLWQPTAGPQPARQPGATADRPAALQTTLTLRVWKQGNLSRALRADEPGVLPLRAGDFLRLEATADRPAYCYLLYIDSAGSVSPMYPWRGYDWNNRLAEQPCTRLAYPEDPGKDAEPLGPGASGIEAIVLLVREQPLADAEQAQLAKLGADKVLKQEPKLDPLRGVAWLHAGDLAKFDRNDDRGRPDQAKAIQVADPVEQLRRLLRTELQPLAGDARAVCYPFAGK